jgi:hypothetical protein
MGERTTGATDTQIEAAVMRRFRNADWTSTTQEAYRDIWEEQAREHAAYLIPPDHRIIGPDDIEALRRVLDIYAAVVDPTFDVERTWTIASAQTDLDRLAALIGGDGNG